MIIAALVGFLAGALDGGKFAEFMAAGALWLASIMAIRRDWAAKEGAMLAA